MLPLCATGAGIHWSEIAWNKRLELVKRLRRLPSSRTAAAPNPCAGQGAVMAPQRAGWRHHTRSPLAPKVSTSWKFLEGKNLPESPSAKPQPGDPQPRGAEPALPAPKPRSSPWAWVLLDPGLPPPAGASVSPLGSSSIPPNEGSDPAREQRVFVSRSRYAPQDQPVSQGLNNSAFSFLNSLKRGMIALLKYEGGGDIMDGKELFKLKNGVGT